MSTIDPTTQAHHLLTTTARPLAEILAAGFRQAWKNSAQCLRVIWIFGKHRGELARFAAGFVGKADGRRSVFTSGDGWFGSMGGEM